MGHSNNWPSRITINDRLKNPSVAESQTTSSGTEWAKPPLNRSCVQTKLHIRTLLRVQKRRQ